VVAATYLNAAVFVFVGLVVSAAFGWGKNWLGKRLTEDRDAIMDKLNQMHTSAIEFRTRLDGHDKEIAFLQGAQSERTASGAEHLMAVRTAAETAALVAATAVQAAREVVKVADLKEASQHDGNPHTNE
jgi:hypothetical protein